MIGFKNYVEQRDLVEAMEWYEKVLETKHIPAIQEKFEFLEFISDETKNTLVEFYRSIKKMESSEFIKKLRSVRDMHNNLKLKLKTELVKELKFNEIKIATIIPIIEKYIKGLIEESKKEDKEPEAMRFARGDKDFR
jgi:TPR repeat protein